jgi:hypothetical protein
MSLSAEQRSLRASVAAHAKYAKLGTAGSTDAARAGWRRRFEDQVDPDRALPPAERERRAEHAIKAHMQALALRSSRARAKRKGPA